MFFFLNLLSFLYITNDVCYSDWASLWLSGKNLPAMQETQVQALGEEDLLEKEMVTHSSILSWEIPWTEVPGGLQAMGRKRVIQDLVTKQNNNNSESALEQIGNLVMFLLVFTS